MDWDAREREGIRAEQEERRRLLAMTEEDAMKEGAPIWYQRMRYLREIEADEYIKKIRRAQPPQEKPITKRRRYGKVSPKGYWMD